jgi:hypothetical protein
VSRRDATLLGQVLSRQASEAAAGTVFRWNTWVLDELVRMPCILPNLRYRFTRRNRPSDGTLI